MQSWKVFVGCLVLWSALLYTICSATTSNIPVEPSSSVELEDASIVQQIQTIFADQQEILNSKGLFDIWKFFRIFGKFGIFS